MEQRSSEWYDLRLGKVTASRVADVVGKTKAGKYTAARETYAKQLIAERLSGELDPSYSGGALADGRDREPDARAAYSYMKQVDVTEVGFIPHPLLSMAGASPDGLVRDAGLVEFKCPQLKAHIETLESEAVPEEYLPQIMWQLACTGRKWCDYGSFHPAMPEAMRLFIKRVGRDDDFIKAIEREVSAFLDEVTARVRKLRDRYDPPMPLTPAQTELLQQSTLLAG